MNQNFFYKLKLLISIIFRKNLLKILTRKDLLFLDLFAIPKLKIHEPWLNSRKDIILRLIRILIDEKDPVSYVNINNGPDILKKYIEIAKFEGNSYGEKFFIKKIYLKKCWKLYCEIKEYYLLSCS